MAIIAGIDEAGYGPTLGPLLVSASVFRVPDEHRDGNLWRLLARSVTTNPKAKRKLVVTDSKLLYNRRKGIGALEEGVLSFLALSEGRFAEIRGLLKALAPQDADDAMSYPWYREQEVEIPLSGRALGLENRVERLRKTMDDCGVHFLGARCVPIFEAAFNESVEETDNKSVVLFDQVVRLIAGMAKKYASEDLLITVDKQGGRNRYGPMLGTRLKGARLVVKHQDSKVGHYHVRYRGSEFDVRFMKGGEKHCMAVALGSMFSKYVRELYMKLFNDFWRTHLPELRPTAGYATDARRFLADIAPVRQKLGIPDDVLIRRR